MPEELGDLDLLRALCDGGLLSESVIAAKEECSQWQFIGIDPEVADGATKSFHTRNLHNIKSPLPLLDGARTASSGN